MRLIFVVGLLLGWSLTARGQALSEEYYRENPSWGLSELWASEDHAFSASSSREPLFEEYALYGFSFVGYDFRGESSPEQSVRLGAVDLREPLERYVDYALVNLLRRVPTGREYRWSNSHTTRGVDARAEYFDPSPYAMQPRGIVSLRYSTRTYRVGAGCSVVGIGDDGWGYSMAAGGRWGSDAVVEGYGTNDEYLWLSGARRWEAESGLEHTLQVALMAAPRRRMQRSWNSEEVVALSGDRYYNSYWGWQGSVRRSSREVEECVPTLYASWDVDDRYLLSNANVSLLVRGGRRGRTSLEWNGAPNPLPDYYGYLPSGLSDEGAALRAREVWLRDDERFTQIDWQSLYLANAISTSGCRYALLEEREDVVGATMDASAGLLGEEGGRVGVRLSAHGSHNYNTLHDALGSAASWGGGEGFDLYDYRLTHRAWQLYAHLRGSLGDGSLSAAAEVGGERVGYEGTLNGYQATRRGINLRSRVVYLLPISRQWQVGVVARYDLLTPHWEDFWGAAEGRLARNPYAKNMNRVVAQLWGEGSVGAVRLHATLYCRYEAGVTTTEHFWNDLESEYSVMLAGGMSSLAAGGELSATLSPLRGLTLEGHFSLQRVGYVGDGVADIVTFDDGRMVASDVELQLRGANASTSPRALAAVAARYMTPRGWLLGVEWAVAGGRRMEPSLLLRSDYVLSRNLSPECRQRCLSTPSLGNAHSLSMFLWRRVGDVTLSLSVRNLLGSGDAYYAGYQPSRLYVTEKDYATHYSPREPRYQYVYPTSALLTIAYEF